MQEISVATREVQETEKGGGEAHLQGGVLLDAVVVDEDAGGVLLDVVVVDEDAGGILLDAVLLLLLSSSLDATSGSSLLCRRYFFVIGALPTRFQSLLKRVIPPLLEDLGYRCRVPRRCHPKWLRPLCRR